MRKTVFVFRALVLLFATGFTVLGEFDYKVGAQSLPMKGIGQPMSPSTLVLFDFESPEGAL